MVPIERPEAPIPGKTYRQLGIQLWGRGAYERELLDGGGTRYKTLSRVEADDIIVNKIWARNGSVAIVPPSLAGCYVSGEFPTFSPIRKKLHPRWFHWYSKTPSLWDQCDEQSRGTSGKNRIRPEKFLEIKIPLPDIDDQRRVVSRIEELAAKVEEARQLRQEAIEEAKAVLIAGWWQVFDAAKTHGWRSLSIEECCEVMIDYRGRTPPLADGGIPHLTSRNIKSGRIDWNTNKFVAEETYEKYMTRGIPKPGDVIFTMEAPLGEAGVVPDQRRFSLAQRTLLLRGRSDVIGGEFLARVIMSPQVHEVIYSQATGTTVKGIASKRLKHIPLPIPPFEEQRRIVGYLDALQTKVGGLKKLQSETAAELDALMPSILSKAFCGEL
jgi:type I restriction enzyme S subunit